MSRARIWLLLPMIAVAFVVATAIITWSHGLQAPPPEGGVSAPRSAESADDRTPSAVVNGVQVPSSIDIGEVPGGTQVPVKIQVTNGNATPVRLTFKTADCGCIAADKNLLLDANQQGDLKLNLTTRNAPGPISRSVYYTVTGGGDPKDIHIALSGIVAGPMLDHNVVQLGIMRAGETKAVSFRVLNPQKWVLMGMRQTSGPTESAIGAMRGNTNDLKQMDHVDLSVTMPDSSGDDLRWEYDLSFQSVDGQRDTHAYCQIFASVENGIFTSNSLYLGLVRKKADTVVERHFALRDSGIELGSIAVLNPDENIGTVALLPSEKDRSAVAIRLTLSKDVKEGMHTFYLRYKGSIGQKSASSARAGRVPVAILVLP
jgi:hypothetical protein